MTSGSPRSERPATIYDVAKRAKVSHETVSRVLRGEPGVKEANRVRVTAALKALNYRPNVTAKALATRRSRRLGAMVYDLMEAGPSQFVEGATEEARSTGYLLDIVSVRSVANGDVATAIALLNQPDLAGIIAFTPTDATREAVAKTSFRIPLFQETEAEDAENPAAQSLNSLGVGLAVDHLVSLGHSRILHVAGPQDWVSARNRLHAYERSMIGHGLATLPVVTASGWSAAAGYAATHLIPDGVEPTALLVGNDQMAIGALLALHEMGLTVPGDVSVVGFDDIAEAPFSIPPLTTVRVDFASAGKRAVRELVAQIEGAPVSPVSERTEVSAHLIVRASSGPSPA
jgi:DNA-binding LacI/PurR family transcriptional regulator